MTLTPDDRALLRKLLERLRRDASIKIAYSGIVKIISLSQLEADLLVPLIERLVAEPHSPLPTIAGRMEMTHEDFQRACAVALCELQENPNCDTALVHVLCEAVRCSRECCELATSSLRVPLIERLLKEKP